MTENKTKKSRWGIGIAVLYSSFVIFILTVVIFSTMQDFSLVEDNYYQKSLSYQDKIDMMDNTNNLLIKPFLNNNINENILTITFPDSQAQNGITGTVHFFRPSNKHADQILPLKLEGSQSMDIPSTRFLKGLWIMKLSWKSAGISYYQEENLTI